SHIIAPMSLTQSSDDFSSLIRDLRTRLGISQEKLATQLRVSFPTVNRWEKGKTEPDGAVRHLISEFIKSLGSNFEDLQARVAAEQASASVTVGGAPSRRSRSSKITQATVNGDSQIMDNRSMETLLWKAACSIRGEKDAPKFKDYILPLLFIKRLSDVFDDEIQRLAETYGDEKAALEILEADHSLVRFYIPPEARWSVVSGRQKFDWPKEKESRTLGEQLTTTIRAIVKHNPSLAGVIDVVDYNETRNGEREISDAALRGVVESLSDPRYRLGLHDVEPDFLGRCYEYLLRKF